MQRFATSTELRGLPGVPNSVRDYMEGEDRGAGRVVEVKGWHRWSDKRKLRWMRDLAQRYGQDPAMNTFVAQEVFQGGGIAPRDYRSQASAILRWVQQRIYYVNEPGEIIRTPWKTIRDKTGDCDDMAVLMATFAQAVALPWRFVLAGKHRGRPARFHERQRIPWGFSASHIYVEVGYPPFSRTPQWVSLEPTIRNAPLGYDVVRNGYVTDANGAAQVPPELAGWGQWGESAPAPQLPAPAQPSLSEWVRSELQPRVILLEGFKAVLIAGVASVITLTWKRLSSARKRRSR